MTQTVDDLILAPEFQAMIPPYPKGDDERLEAQVLRERRCPAPVKYWKDTNIVLCGHRELRYCMKHQVPIDLVVLKVQPPTREVAKEYFIRKQLERDDLTMFQAAELGVHLWGLISSRAKDRQRKAGGAEPQRSSEPPLHARKEAAEVAGVSEQTLDRVKRILGSGDDQVIELLRHSEISINRAYQALREGKEEANEGDGE
ncbi:MAG: hypothetical protein GXP25_08525 [Planctomycetes bacterium]|nr:hypothetical protein [Planctomycetota bacterium]